MKEIATEGLENVNDRHRESALRLHRGLESLGLKLFVKDPVMLNRIFVLKIYFQLSQYLLQKYRLPTLTTVEVPENINWKGVVDHLMNKSAF